VAKTNIKIVNSEGCVSVYRECVKGSVECCMWRCKGCCCDLLVDNVRFFSSI